MLLRNSIHIDVYHDLSLMAADMMLTLIGQLKIVGTVRVIEIRLMRFVKDIKDN